MSSLEVGVDPAALLYLDVGGGVSSLEEGAELVELENGE